MKLFGTAKPNANVSAQDNIQKLREMEEILGRKSEFLEKKIENELTTAKKYSKTNKRMAIAALNRKKRLMQQLTQIDGTITNLEFQREALESARTNVEVFKVMGEAGKTLKGIHKNLNVDNIQDVMDDLAEQHDVANEINDAISRPVGGVDVDEDELMAELEELEEEELMASLTSDVPFLPSVPGSSLHQPQSTRQQETDDEKLRELERWAM